MVAGDPYNVPSRPGKPEVCDWGPDFAEIRWSTPEEDGGAEISSYRIEMRGGGSARGGWRAAATSEESEATVGGGDGGGERVMEEGQEYQFRVVALNAAGESDASRASEPCVARPRFSRPELSGLPEAVSVHCSQVLRIRAAVRGSPRPALSWWGPGGAKMEAVSVEGEEGVALEEEWGGDEEGGSAVMVVRNLSTKDSGSYKLKAKNQEGSAEAEVKVTVMGPPGKPVGPMEVSDVRKTSCRITWQRPENDGGAQVWSKEISSTARIKCMRYFTVSSPLLSSFPTLPDRLRLTRWRGVAWSRRSG